jgi:hypothetical protein
MSVSQTLERALAVIDTPEKWCVGKRGETIEGFHVEANDWRAVRHCALGAIERATGEPITSSDTPEIVALVDSLLPTFKSASPWKIRQVAAFNNTSDYDTVRAWFQRAIRNAKTAESETLTIPDLVTDPVLAA